MKTRVNVVLGLHNLSIPQKIEKARFITTSMSANPKFPNPSPSLNIVYERTAMLETAYLAAQGGGRDETALMYVREVELDKALIKLGHYVEDIANEDPESAEATILSAGMNPKKSPLNSAKEFNVMHGDNEGEVKLRTRYKQRTSYIWEYSAASDEPPVWTRAAITLRASHTINGLESGTRYAFRVAVIDKNGQGPWSNKVELIAL